MSDAPAVPTAEQLAPEGSFGRGEGLGQVGPRGRVHTPCTKAHAAGGAASWVVGLLTLRVGLGRTGEPQAEHDPTGRGGLRPTTIWV